MYKKHVKPFFDTIIATLILLILAPILFTCTFLLLFANNGTPFFFQKRPGLKGIIFTIVKFKTMNDRMDASGNLLPDAERLTAIGRFIRKTSLDELPQLWNVLKGDMSLVGPRPLLVEYMPLYNDMQKRRHEVRPGITGWAQVNGRNAISWEQKFEYDVWYVDSVSLTLDLKILFLTIKKVLKKEGISAQGHATMAAFNGRN